MYSRWIGPHNLNADRGLMIAGFISCCWQTCFAKQDIEWHGDELPPPDPLPPTEPTWQVTIQSGMVLSKLCSQTYGRGTPNIANAVARYNGMEDANQLAVGDVILLPPYGDLRDEDGAPLPPLVR